MDLTNAKSIGYHLRDENPVEDPESHLPWAFAHSLTALPGPQEEKGIHLVPNSATAFWLGEGGGIPLAFHVTGWVTDNPEDPRRPLAHVHVSSQPLLADRWNVSLISDYGQLSGRSVGFNNHWSFQHQESGLSLVIDAQREWDGGDAWLSNDAEEFALLVAGKLGWPHS